MGCNPTRNIHGKIMTPNRPGRLHASLIRALTILIMLAATQALAKDLTALPGNDCYSILASVQAMHRGQFSRSGPDIIVFEVGGGDPAMNGSSIYLRIDHNERSLVWKTGLNVRSVKMMSFGSGNTVLLRVEEDFMNSKSAIVQRTATYRLFFHLDDGMLRDTVIIENDVAVNGKE